MGLADLLMNPEKDHPTEVAHNFDPNDFYFIPNGTAAPTPTPAPVAADGSSSSRSSKSIRSRFEFAQATEINVEDDGLRKIREEKNGGIPKIPSAISSEAEAANTEGFEARNPFGSSYPPEDDWRQSFRALLPNINISFSVQPSTQSQAGSSGWGEPTPAPAPVPAPPATPLAHPPSLSPFFIPPGLGNTWGIPPLPGYDIPSISSIPFTAKAAPAPPPGLSMIPPINVPNPEMAFSSINDSNDPWRSKPIRPPPGLSIPKTAEPFNSTQRNGPSFDNVNKAPRPQQQETSFVDSAIIGAGVAYKTLDEPDWESVDTNAFKQFAALPPGLNIPAKASHFSFAQHNEAPEVTTLAEAKDTSALLVDQQQNGTQTTASDTKQKKSTQTTNTTETTEAPIVGESKKARKQRAKLAKQQQAQLAAQQAKAQGNKDKSKSTSIAVEAQSEAETVEKTPEEIAEEEKKKERAQRKKLRKEKEKAEKKKREQEQREKKQRQERERQEKLQREKEQREQKEREREQKEREKREREAAAAAAAAAAAEAEKQTETTQPPAPAPSASKQKRKEKQRANNQQQTQQQPQQPQQQPQQSSQQQSQPTQQHQQPSNQQHQHQHQHQPSQHEPQHLYQYQYPHQHFPPPSAPVITISHNQYHMNKPAHILSTIEAETGENLISHLVNNNTNNTNNLVHLQDQAAFVPDRHNSTSPSGFLVDSLSNSALESTTNEVENLEKEVENARKEVKALADKLMELKLKNSKLGLEN
eukprot:TRINITY_DN3332_c0_g1_i1.p1 TRINITY_DN3332_c0_g1~~TRINITY_DN3332_c0_g1_i1.p1  ORF type:complete len:756 (+),score=260.95 TRINITY_DN3332_c0_g1_i1:1827-4094(+)